MQLPVPRSPFHVVLRVVMQDRLAHRRFWRTASPASSIPRHRMVSGRARVSHRKDQGETGAVGATPDIG